MHKIAFMFVLLFAVSASAAERCGTDNFGNTVCMDKDGVVSTVPPERAGSDGNKDAPQSASVEDAGRKTGRDEKIRCGDDSFGNRVCGK
jgi:hypothetical protein